MGKPIYLLLLVAHCDDAELWAGGTICRLIHQGYRVVAAITHHNSVRKREAASSAALLGYEVWYRERTSVIDWTRTCLRKARPEVLMTHHSLDPHFEHHQLSQLTLRALTKSRQRSVYPRRWYWFDTYYSTEELGCPVLIDISGEFTRKCSALECHRSQEPSSLVTMARAMNQLHGQRIRAEYAEAFFPFALLGRWPKLRELP